MWHSSDRNDRKLHVSIQAKLIKSVRTLCPQTLELGEETLQTWSIRNMRKKHRGETFFLGLRDATQM